MVKVCQLLEEELFKPANALMCVLKPRIILIGSIPEGTRIHSASELDATVKFEGLESRHAFTVQDNAMELLFEGSEASHPLSMYLTGPNDSFDFPAFFAQFLREVSLSLNRVSLQTE